MSSRNQVEKLNQLKIYCFEIRERAGAYYVSYEIENARDVL